MGSKKLVLGYTRGGHEVLLPTDRKPDMAPFSSWTPGDHLDASRILVEHGERESDPVGTWCEHWADVHWAIGKKAKKKLRKVRERTQILGSVETKILSKRRH